MPDEQNNVNEQPEGGAQEPAQDAAPQVQADAVAQAAQAADAAKTAQAEAKKQRVRRQSSVVKADLATGQQAVVTVVKDQELAELPSKVKLAAPYGFYEDDGAFRFWAQGQEVEDPEEIALLIERGAIFTEE